jgi:branched chain amino acid efflux pump
MIPAADLLTIALMALTTYATRIGGYLLLRNRTLSPRAQVMMESAPGCVLISVIAPVFVSRNPADLVALTLMIGAAALRWPMLAVMALGVCSSWLLGTTIG